MIKCKERFWVYIGTQFTVQCSRKATIEGYCKWHHPESIKKRKKKQQQKWKWDRIEQEAMRENRIREWAKENGFKLVMMEP